ncbi:hypothetical protein ABT392_05420 [Paucibacter sp. JuS9]|uniref:hypothetical protein n=1 Tax=Paucibacter sp. JuS9 TaxID=3228748 RepID=UPI0037575413
MQFRPPQFDLVAESLKPVLRGLPGVLVAIDGRDGAGKTTLGRFLAWYFNVALVETDLFLRDGEYQIEAIRSIVDGRLAIPRPVLVEGIALRELLHRIGRDAAYSIHIRNTSFAGSLTLAQRLDAYELKYQPMQNANHRLELGHE